MNELAVGQSKLFEYPNYGTDASLSGYLIRILSRTGKSVRTFLASSCRGPIWGECIVPATRAASGLNSGGSSS